MPRRGAAAAPGPFGAMVGRDHGPQTIWHETVATRPHRDSEQFRSAPRTFQPRHGRLSGRQTDTLTPPAGRRSGDAGTRRRGRKPDVRSEPAPVRRESRRRCRAFTSLAARRARAAAGADAAHRRAHGPGRGRPESQAASRHSCRDCSNWVDRRPQVRIDIRWAAGNVERMSQECGGTGRARAGCHHGPAGPVIGAATGGNPHRADRVRERPRSGRRRLRREPGAPGGNATGFTTFEYGMSAKWLELLKEIAPGVKRAAVLRDPAIACRDRPVRRNPSGAPSLGVEVSPVDVRDADEIERAITALRARRMAA